MKHASSVNENLDGAQALINGALATGSGDMGKMIEESDEAQSDGSSALPRLKVQVDEAQLFNDRTGSSSSCSHWP